jgi:hypothetical protein
MAKARKLHEDPEEFIGATKEISAESADDAPERVTNSPGIFVTESPPAVRAAPASPAPALPVQVFEIFSVQGTLRNDFTDEELSRLSPAQQELWAALRIASIDETDAGAGLSAALANVSAAEQTETRAIENSSAVKAGYVDLVVSDADKRTLRDPFASIEARTQAMNRASAIETKNRMARLNAAEDMRLVEVRRMARVNGVQPSPEQAAIEAKANAKRAALIDAAAATVSAATLELMAARTRLSEAHDFQRIARRNVAAAIAAWQAQFEKPDHNSIVRAMMAQTQAAAMAVADGTAPVPAAPARKPWPLEVAMTNRPRQKAH